MTQELLLPIAFAIIAFIYASVGFGGGSSYLALLAVMGMPYQDIRLTALVCNIVVVLGSSIVFIKKNQLDWRKNIALVCASVPLAFLGARVRISESTFFLILGTSLLFAALMLWLHPENRADNPAISAAPKPIREAGIGGGIGLLSGLVGIGGGIFLSPVLHFLHWDSTRKIAATASLFILVNSVAGVSGQLLALTSPVPWWFLLQLSLAVFLGGQIGMRYSLKAFSPRLIRRITAMLVLIAGLEVLGKQLLGQ